MGKLKMVNLTAAVPAVAFTLALGLSGDAVAGAAAVEPLLFGLATGSCGDGGEGSLSIFGCSTLYRIDKTTGAATAVGGRMAFRFCSGMDFNASGTLFATCDPPFGAETTGVLITIDTATGVGTEVGVRGIDGPISDMSFKNSSGTLFAYFPGGSHKLGTINVSTGQATIIGSTGLSGGGNALAYRQSTNELFHGNAGGLRTLNQSTGAQDVFVGAFSYSGSCSNSRPSAMKFEPGTETLFASFKCDEEGDLLATINPTTGFVTFLGSTRNGLDAIALGTPDTDGDGIPDAIDNCRLVPNPDQADRDGDLVGDVCDNCPQIVNPNQADDVGNGQGDACRAHSQEDLQGPVLVQPGAPMLFTAILRNTSSSPMLTIRPDCVNTTFTLKCGTSMPDPIISEKMYGIPDDLITIPAFGEVSITCDVGKQYDGALLSAAAGTNAGECVVEATYANHVVDRNIVNGVCQLPNPADCIPGIWIGSVTGPADGISITGTPVTRPGIDILPSATNNVWPCGLRSPIVVAVLGSEGFDASTVNLATVRFGKDGTPLAQDPTRNSVPVAKRMKDVNGDGRPDMMLSFSFQDTGFSCSDIPGGKTSVEVNPILQGATTGGQPIGDSGLLKLTR